MTYDEALAFIHGAYGLGRKDGLSNMRGLLTLLGDPQDAFPALHVAGTNGKGSVCAFAHAALRCAGYRTGLYTSPFLQRYNERMRVNGVPIADGQLAAITERVAKAVESLRLAAVRPTEFEIGTAIGFCYFAQARVDIAIIEVGLGGRLDPTNVIRPQVAGIASIGLDHTRVLGDTLEAIAREKAGIAKPGVPVVLSGQANAEVRAAVRARCGEAGAPLTVAGPAAGDTPLGLAGSHQRYNAGVAAAMLEKLRERGWPLTDADISNGLRRARWPGRLEWIHEEPPLLLDGAHNPQGAAALREYIRTLDACKTVLLCGVMRDKDWRAMAETFAGFADEVIAVEPDSARSLDKQALADAFAALGVAARAAPSIPEGLAMARGKAGPSGRVVVAGSLYLVGEARGLAVPWDTELLNEE